MHLREGARLKQVVDRGALGAHSAGQIDVSGRGVGAAEGAAFDGVGFEMQECLDFGGGHDSRW